MTDERLIEEAAKAMQDAARERFGDIVIGERAEEMTREYARRALAVFEAAPRDSQEKPNGDLGLAFAPTDHEREALAHLIRDIYREQGYYASDQVVADALLAAGLRRSEVPEPSAEPTCEHGSPLSALCDYAARYASGEMLSEKDLYDLPAGSLVCRSWPTSPGPDMPEVYQKRAGWWLELTDRSSDVESSTGVIWSEHARFTLIHSAALRAAGGVQ